MSTGAAPSRRPHVLVIPLLSMGHLLPLLDFSHLLSTRHRVCLTVAVAPSTLPFLSAFLASTPLAAALPLLLPEHVLYLAPGAHHALLAAPLSALRAPFLSWTRSRRDPPTAVVFDFFLGWAQLVAEDLHVPRVTFYNIGAFAAAALSDLWKSTLPLDPDNSFALSALPGSPSFPYEHVPSVVRSYVPGDPDWELVREGFLLNSRAWGTVVNMFDAMEGDFLEYLKRCSGHGRPWAISPVADSGYRRGESRGERTTVEAQELFSWLGACPTRFVLYFCFGTMHKAPPAQAAALGAALEASGARFVWALGSADATVLPEGLNERAAGKGRVMRGWMPQVEILRHAAVGEYVAHCAWNSTLEGVALVAWPMKADQFIDAALVVDMHGAAVRIVEGEDAALDVRQLARVFADAMGGGTEWAGVRVKAGALAAAAAEAVQEGDSSWLDLVRMVEEMEALVAA